MLRSQHPAPTNAAIAPSLQVALLGTPEVTWDGQQVLVPRRQARALFYRLAAAPYPLPREQLGFLFWPDSPQAVARRNLTVLLAQLRRVLPPELLLTPDDVIGLRPATVLTDTATFAALVPHALQAGQLAQLADATRLYRGPFLDGFGLPDAPEFEAWIDGERQAWERRYLDALATLVAGYTSAGNHQAAIAAAQRALATDPLAEEQHRSLIELHAHSGDRVAALRQFEQCVVVLERELGVGPLPETRAVYEAIRDGHYPLQARQTSTAAPVAAVQAAEASPAAFAPAAPPTPLGTLIGREAELVALHNLLRSAEARLLTVTGPGGSGKTRLALEVLQRVAPHFPGGVVYVPLAPLRDPALVLDAIAQACGTEGTGMPSLTLALHTALHDQQVLLVLDNFEHLLPGAPLLAELLGALPLLRILVTSRSRLHLSGEHVFALSPLPLPTPSELPALHTLAVQPAIALLLARTQALNPQFALTAENAADLAAICVRLDGLPLALELAAARLRLLAPRALLRRLDYRLVLLTQGPRDLPDRQRSLREVIAWSYGLLDSTQRALFACLAVFAGSWSLDAAEELGRLAGHPALQSPGGVLDALAALVDASLVQQISGTNGEPRMQLLETIREYAQERLDERGVAPTVAMAHTRYYTTQAAANLRTPNAPTLLARLDEDHANMLAALEYATLHGERGAVIALIHSLIPFWCVRGYLHEGRYWIERTLTASLPPEDEAPPDAADRELLARTYLSATNLYFLQGEYAAAIAYLETSIALWRTLDNGSQLAIALITLAAAHTLAGNLAAASGPLAEGEALTETQGDAEARAWLALASGRVARHRGRPREARAWLGSARSYYRQQGDLWFLAGVLLDLAPVLLALGDEAAAEAHASEALSLARQLRSQTMIANALNDLGEIARYQGHDEMAETYYTESMQLLQRMGNRSEVPRLLHNLAHVTLRQGDLARAADRFAESLQLFAERQIERGIMEGLIGMAAVATAQGQPLTAAQLGGAAESLSTSAGWELWPPDQLAYAGALTQARALSDHAAFDQAWQTGRSLSVAAACALAGSVRLAVR